MQERKKSMLPANRAALYQQDPVEAMDSIFKRSYFKYYLSSEFENPQAIIKKDDFTW
ncbi:MAG: hypothetical protein LBD11_08470 [Candidatus Peribacteria bacterium]|jgi:hypothetical protein|nr:hypothetical protein [Candidatus Peribacteria bacterium]